MDWMELVIETTTQGTDLIANILYDAGATGVVIEDPEDARVLMQQKDSWDYIQPGLLNTEGDAVLVKGYLPVDGSLNGRLEMVRENLRALPGGHAHFGSLGLTIGQVRDEEWAENWKKFYKPMRIGQNIIIKPTWEDYEPGKGDIVVVLDPGMAFGTGTHESTALCIELLEKYTGKGFRVIDIGCGSGILAITSAKLGAGSVEAYDLQPMAVDITMENAKLNGMDKTVRADRADLLDKVEGKADLIVSNIVADVIIRMCRPVAQHLKPGGLFIASGIIRDRAEEVNYALKHNGMEIVEFLERNEWRALAARMKG